LSDDPQPLLELPPGEPEDPFGVLVQAREAGSGVHAEPLGGSEPATELALVRRPLGAEPDDALVHVAPIRNGLGLERGAPARWAARRELRGATVANEKQGGRSNVVMATTAMGVDRYRRIHASG
jgi:hypothetical protein